MEIAEFLLQMRADIRETFNDRVADPNGAAPFEEIVFTERMMDHMQAAGMTFEYQAYHYDTTISRSRLRLSGHAVSEDGEQLDLFVSLFQNVETITPIPDSETKAAADHCLRFLKYAVEGRLAETMDPTNEAYELALSMPEVYATQSVST